MAVAWLKNSWLHSDGFDLISLRHQAGSCSKTYSHRFGWQYRCSECTDIGGSGSGGGGGSTSPIRTIFMALLRSRWRDGSLQSAVRLATQPQWPSAVGVALA
eukprot:1446849-Prymnesium_polylepis.1